MKKEQDNIEVANPEAMRRLAERKAAGKSPDFTVTGAYVRETWRTAEKDGFIIAWETESAGFGELTVVTKNGKTRVDSEGMSMAFCLRVFGKLIGAAS